MVEGPLSQKSQERVRRELVALVEDGGSEPLIERTIVEPTDDFFPGPLTLDEPGLTSLATRVFELAALPLDVEVISADRREHESIWLAELDGESCRVAAALSDLRAGSGASGGIPYEPDPGGTLCLVAAEAYVRSRGLTSDRATGFRDSKDRARQLLAAERERIAIAGIYLGFGVLIANHSFKRESRALIRNSVVMHTRRGFASPRLIAYALALQIAERGTGFWSRRRSTRWLDPDARAYCVVCWCL
jgi:hypothetical protein